MRQRRLAGDRWQGDDEVLQLNPRGVVVSVTLVVAAGTALTFGLWSNDEDAARAGPLVSLVEGGGNSLYAPTGRARWSGTFGSLLLCSRTGATVTIESVDFHHRVRPLRTRAAIRQVPGRSERAGGGEKWHPMIANLGRISELRGREFVSASLEPARGASFDTACRDGPDAPYTELLTSMTVDRRGGWIDEITIHYSSGDHDHELAVPWDYVACGVAVRELERHPGSSSDEDDPPTRLCS